MPSTAFARRATWNRARGLLREFGFEQSDPDRFYSALAEDTAEMVEALYPEGTTDAGSAASGSSLTDAGSAASGSSLHGAAVLDVGGGPGFFADAFTRRGADYLSVEPDAGEMHAAGIDHRTCIRAQGQHLPLATGCVDIAYSSNVAEHTDQPWEMADELVRVTRPGGTVIISYTLWWGPFGGHEMGLTHYFGGNRAARWYTRKHGKLPKNLYGVSLFPITAQAGLDWARTVPDADLVAAFPRYLPRWAWPVIRIPVIREVAATNLVMVLRKR